MQRRHRVPPFESSAFGLVFFVFVLVVFVLVVGDDRGVR
jgi:hypothetical protein